MSSLLGIFLGLLIGIISGVVMIKLLIMLLSTKIEANMITIGELLAIPTFWFGGAWLTTSFLKDVNLNDILETYISSLAITFLLICLIPLVRWVIRMGNEIGKNEGDSNA